MSRFWLWLALCAGPACAALQPTTTTLTLVSGTPVYGATLNFRAKVTAQLGSIIFTVDGVSQNPIPVDVNSGATLAVSLLPGSHTIGASFPAGGVYQSSAATPLTVTVGKAPTIIGMSAGPAQIGQPVVITATVSLTGNGTVNSGTVGFAPAPECGAVPVQYGIARCTITFGATGSFFVYASFSGDDNTTSSMGSMSLTVTKAVPGVYLTTTPLSPIWGSAAGVNVLVTGANSLAAPTGSVTFASGGKTLSTQPLSTDGHAALSANWDVGSFAITAVYSGDSNYLASPPVPTTLNVGKASTLLTVSSDPAQIGQPVTLRASVVLAVGTGPITGTVDFALGGKPVAGCTGIPVTGGLAVCQASAAQFGSLTLSASFSGDANIKPSTATAAIAVGKAVPGIYLAQTPTAPVYGQSATVNCLLLGATGLPTPTGNIVFSSGGKTLATQPVGTDGRASWSSTLPVGASTIAAAYPGDDSYQSPQPASLTVTVGKAPTTLVVSSDPAQVGQPVILRASVSLALGSGPVTGTVDFTIGGKAVAGCAGVPLINGAASCPASFPQLGSITLAGSFSGDANTLPATASAATTVSKAVPGMYLAQSPAAPVFGQQVAVDCLLLGAAGLPTPSGIVSFSDGGRFIAGQTIGADGHAPVTTTLAPGTHTITASYNGDTNYLAASPTPLLVVVAQAATTTSLTVVTGGPLTAVVTVTAPGAGSPTGTVQFRSGTTLIGTAPLAAKGSGFSAVLATSNATGSITASYLGDANFAPSSSSAVTVSATQSIVTVASDRNPSSAGQPVTFTTVVSISPQATAGSPTGSVSLSSDGADVGSAALSNGQAVIHATLAAGTHAITARYSGDPSYPAGSGTYTQTVSAAVAGLTLSSSSPISVVGQPVTLTVVLQVQSGTVQFTEGGTSLGSASIAAGAASLPVSLPAGVHTITASWAGDANFAAGSVQLVQTVTKAITAVTLALSGGSLLATVGVSAPGAGSPGGTVRFLDAASSQVLNTVTLAGLTASAPLPAAADSVVAIYSGDANFFGATSATLHLLAVTNAASYASGGIAADEIVTLFGPNLAGSTKVKATDSSGAAFNAPLFYVSPTQASILIPAGLGPGPATVSIITPARPLSALVNIGAVAPGLFTADGSGQGAPAAQVITLKPDGTPSDPVLATAPIDLNSGAVYLVLYGTGLRHSAALPVCTVAGQPAQVLYAGAQGAMAGLDQVNILVPASLKSGTATLNLTVDGNPANPVTLSIR
ncbi:MAG: Ig-like domain repeat protein [Candidatus Sulfopaludibacter sp.]|nr:Ig-like domain repeat protein [Candidatus Sulfopaludibacter sp.]